MSAVSYHWTFHLIGRKLIRSSTFLARPYRAVVWSVSQSWLDLAGRCADWRLGQMTMVTRSWLERWQTWHQIQTSTLLFSLCLKCIKSRLHFILIKVISGDVKLLKWDVTDQMLPTITQLAHCLSWQWTGNDFYVIVLFKNLVWF